MKHRREVFQHLEGHLTRPQGEAGCAGRALGFVTLSGFFRQANGLEPEAFYLAKGILSSSCLQISLGNGSI